MCDDRLKKAIRDEYAKYLKEREQFMTELHDKTKIPKDVLQEIAVYPKHSFVFDVLDEVLKNSKL